ncbi:MAG: hypothetical protein QXN10_03285 [Desulfurococcaceae archaeon]
MFIEIAVLVVMAIALLMDLKYSGEISPFISLVIVLIGVICDYQYIVIAGISFFITHRLVILSVYTIKIYKDLAAFIEIVKEPLLLFLLVTIAGIISANAIIPGLDQWSSSVIFLLIVLLAIRNIAGIRIDDLSFIGDFLLKDLHDLINGIDALSNIFIAITCLIAMITWRFTGFLISLGYLIVVLIGSRIRSKRQGVKKLIKLIPTLLGLLIGFIY